MTTTLTTLRKAIKKAKKRGNLGINDYQHGQDRPDYIHTIRVQFNWDTAVDLLVDELSDRITMKIWHIDKGLVLHPHYVPDDATEDALDDAGLILERASDIATQLSSPSAKPRRFPSFDKATCADPQPRSDHALAS